MLFGTVSHVTCKMICESSFNANSTYAVSKEYPCYSIENAIKVLETGTTIFSNHIHF